MSADRVELRYVLDEAEIPTFQQRGVPDAALLGRKRAEVRRRLVLTVDGRRVALAPGRAGDAQPSARAGRADDDARGDPPRRRRSAIRAGRGARRDVPRARRLEGDRRAARPRHRRPRERAGGRPDPRAPALPARRCSTARRRARRPASTCAPAPAPCRRPTASAGSPAPTRGAPTTGSPRCSATPRPAEASCCCCSWPPSAGAPCTRSRPGTARRWSRPTSSGPAARPRQAVALGAIVTATHTAGVFALGGVTLALSAYVLPETLYPVAQPRSPALLVVGIGARCCGPPAPPARGGRRG